MEAKALLDELVKDRAYVAGATEPQAIGAFILGISCSKRGSYPGVCRLAAVGNEIDGSLAMTII